VTFANAANEQSVRCNLLKSTAVWLAVFALVLFEASLEASAQSALQMAPGSASPTDGQKREFNRSYVQAATDCLARAISANSLAMSHALGERWSEAVAATGATCREPLARMVAQHDRLYGEGTGEAFLKDTYFSDLPRALMLRLTPEFERRAAE
jgi:hypothetical protein